MSGAPDDGLQPERTTLSWRRTTLAIAAASIAIARNLVILGHEVSAVAVTVAGAMYVVLTRFRERLQSTSIRVTATAAVTMVLGVVELVWLMVA